MARSFAATGQPGPKTINLNRGRGGFYCGRGRFGAMQGTSQSQVNNAVEISQLATYSNNFKILDKNSSAKTSAGNVGDGAIGAKTAHPPTKLATISGRGNMMRGRRGGRRGGCRGGGNCWNPVWNQCCPAGVGCRCSWTFGATGPGCSPSALATARKLSTPYRGQLRQLGGAVGISWASRPKGREWWIL